jgi:serine/threonine-protein kinase
MRICPHCGHRGTEEQCPRDGYPTVAADLVSAEDGERGAPPLVGSRFGDRYVVDALVGEGGMGWVFRATHKYMQQTVALKVMRRDVARNRGAIERFFQEARACSRLRHPHTIKVHDFGVSDDGYPFLVMEYLEGASLDVVLTHEGALAPARVVRIALQLGKSLAEAHGLGLVHRDLKPSNIFLAHIPGEVDYVKVLDFGIAKFVAGEEAERGPGAGALTGTGMVVGTPRYMAPEQVRGRPLDGRADLYALGHLLYEMLSGRPAFRADSSAELMAMQLTETPAPLDELLPAGAVPSALTALAQQLLAKNPDERPASAEVVLQRLTALAPGGVDRSGAAPRAAEPPRPARSRHIPPSAVAPAPSLTTSGVRPRPGGHRTLWQAAAGAAALAVALGVAIALLLPPGPRDAPGGAGPAGPAGPAAGPAAGLPDTAAVVAAGPDVDGGSGARRAASAPEPTPGRWLSDRTPDADSRAATAVLTPPDGGAPVARHPPSAPVARHPPSADDATAAAPATAAAAAATPDYTATPPAAPAPTADVRLETVPSGAEVRRGGELLGRTPYTLRAPAGAEVALTLARRGYDPVEATIVPGETTRRSWTLVRARRERPERPGPGAEPRPEPPPRLELPVFE